MGEKEAILIDGQFTLADAHRLIAMILESKKTLTTVYVTHDHPDHYFGLVAIKQAFPKAKLVALPATIVGIKKSWPGKVKQWGPMYGANLTDAAGHPHPAGGQDPDAGGADAGDPRRRAGRRRQQLVRLDPVDQDGDRRRHRLHRRDALDGRDRRRRPTGLGKTLDELTALGATTVVAGHKDPKAKDDPAGIEQTHGYLKAFDAALATSKTPDELEAKMKAKYPTLALPIIAHFGAAAQFPAADAAKK